MANTPVCVVVTSLPVDDFNVEDFDDVGNVVRAVATSLADVNTGADFTTIKISFNRVTQSWRKNFCNNTRSLLWISVVDFKY